MDDVPLPAWDYLNVKTYFDKSGDRLLPMEAVRGCPYRCTFCNTHMTWGYKLRYKSVGLLIEEMKILQNTYHAPLHFIDDNRSVNRAWMIDFLKSTIREHIVLSTAPSSFHANHLDEELIDLLKEAGVKTIGLGVESGSPEMQKRLNKQINLDSVKKLVKLIKSKGLHVHINFIVGFPKETINQIQETLKLARQLKAHSNQFLILVPYPGTEIYIEAKEEDLLNIEESNLDNFEPRRSGFLRSQEWTYSQLLEMLYDFNIELNFLENPSLSEAKDQGDFLDFLDKLLLRIPGHVIAALIAGYISLQKNEDEKGNHYFASALKSLENKSVYETFSKYLDWEHPAINAFRFYCEKSNVCLKELG